VRRAYRRATELELGFFTAVWESTAWEPGGSVGRQ
jgi:thiaminase (transcriptional activator TenA)